MSSTDTPSDLDSRISAIVEHNVTRLRDELMDRMRRTESRLEAFGQRLGGEPPPAAAAEPAPAPVAAAGSEPLDELFEAVVAIDRASSQQDVLAALLEGAGRFAGRSALFLTRSDSAQGWGSYGFEEIAGNLQDTRLDYAGGPLATLAEGRGCVPLDARQCAQLCEQIGAAAADEGLLVPFVLRDKVAAALYVDRGAADPPLVRRAVQLLTWDAAQAVEGLALRERSETPTLQLADEGSAAGVAVWEGPAAEPEAAPEPAPEPEAAAVEFEPAAAEPEPAAIESVAFEAEPEETTAVPGLAEPEVEIDLEPAAEPEPQAEAGAAEAEWQEMELGAAEPEPEPSESSTRPLEALVEPAEPEDHTSPAGIQATAVEAPAPEAAPPPPPAAPAVGMDGPPGGDSTMVMPPEDVAGPGWAFTASRGTAETGDEGQHEEARRLARLLVTEIKLYNEEQVEEGRRSKDIYIRLKEDIDRSRQIFNERVDEEVRGETDYFQEEMVRILAAGDAEALGI